MATRRQDFFMSYSCYRSNQSLRVTPSRWFLLVHAGACGLLILLFLKKLHVYFFWRIADLQCCVCRWRDSSSVIAIHILIHLCISHIHVIIECVVHPPF